MSDLSSIEKRKLERLLGMGSGYVLNFSDRTFSEFFRRSTPGSTSTMPATECEVRRRRTVSALSGLPSRITLSRR